MPQHKQTRVKSLPRADTPRFKDVNNASEPIGACENNARVNSLARYFPPPLGIRIRIAAIKTKTLLIKLAIIPILIFLYTSHRKHTTCP